MEKNAKIGTFFYKERKRTQKLERSFEKNGCPTLKITDQYNICASNVFKAKTNEKYEEHFNYGFYFKTQNALFWGSTNLFF